jgi:hypothetical protein
MVGLLLRQLRYTVALILWAKCWSRDSTVTLKHLAISTEHRGYFIAELPSLLRRQGEYFRVWVKRRLAGAATTWM